MAQFQNKSVVISGGCSGIGYEVAKHMLIQGAKVSKKSCQQSFSVIKNVEIFIPKNVAILDIAHTNNAADTLQAEFKTQTVIFIKTDISKKDQVKDAFDELVRKFKIIDIVLCNAGILNDRDYELSVNVNLVIFVLEIYLLISKVTYQIYCSIIHQLGTLHTIFAAMDAMSKSKGGNGGIIATTASVSGLEPLFSCPVYCATKSGIISLGRSFGV